MSLPSLPRPARYDYLLVVPILALAFYIAFIPHTSYPYPVHLDEWVQLAYSDALIRSGDIFHPLPFTGQTTTSLVSLLELGFHILFGVFYRISGLDWMTIFRYFPGILFMITVFSVFVMGRRSGFGREAAFFTCLIPTTVGILGPGFLVPVSLALPFIPLSLFIIFYLRNPGAYLALFIFAVFLLITHPTSVIIFILIIAPAVLFYLKQEPRHGIILILAGAVPFLITLPWTYSLISGTAVALFTPKGLPGVHDLPYIVRTFGYLPVALSILGTFWLAWRRGTTNYGLALGLLVMVAMLATFYTLHYGVDAIYLRGILYTFMMLGISAGAGLMMLSNIQLPERWKLPWPARRIGYIFAAAIIVIVLWLGIPVRQHIPYYNIIDTTDYEAFTWIRDNIGDNYRLAILDPWKATSFSAITGKYVYARLHVAPDIITRRAKDFLDGGCQDTDFLRQNGISIVYTRDECSNPDLQKVSDNVYLYDQAR